MASWQRDFASGLIILVPLLVTLILLAWIYSHLASVPIPLDPAPLRVLLTLVIFVLLVFSIGYLMRTAIGSVMERAIDDLMNQLPGLRVVYNASKMAVETAIGGAGELQEPVRLEVWNGLRMTAFKTGNRASDGREILFLPTAPNITTGFVIEVEEDRYTEIEDTVEDALTRLLSAGFGEKNDENVADMIAQRESGGKPEEVSVSDVTPQTAAGADTGGTPGGGTTAADGDETTTDETTTGRITTDGTATDETSSDGTTATGDDYSDDGATAPGDGATAGEREVPSSLDEPVNEGTDLGEETDTGDSRM